MCPLFSSLSALSSCKRMHTYTHAPCRLLELSPGQKIADQARQVLTACEKAPNDAVRIEYDPRNPFDICSITFTPIYRGSKFVEDPYTGVCLQAQGSLTSNAAAYHPNPHALHALEACLSCRQVALAISRQAFTCAPLVPSQSLASRGQDGRQGPDVLHRRALASCCPLCPPLLALLLYLLLQVPALYPSAKARSARLGTLCALGLMLRAC